MNDLVAIFRERAAWSSSHRDEARLSRQWLFVVAMVVTIVTCVYL